MLEDYDPVISEKYKVNGEEYLVQGQVDDPIHMARLVDNVLECERDAVQKMYDEVLEE